MRLSIGAGLGVSCLLGCSAGGVLDIGSNDAGNPSEASPAPTVFSAAAVQKAREMCAYIDRDPRWTTYSQAELRSDLTGGWLLCYFRSTEDERSFQFTADGHWYTLADDRDGGLRRTSSGDAGGLIGYQGAYSFSDGMGRPSGPDGPAVYLATNGVTWFHPEFTGPLMSVNFVTDASENIYVHIEP